MYYYSNHSDIKSPILWDGEITFHSDISYDNAKMEKDIRDLFDTIFEVNFYIHVYEETIYLSLCMDSFLSCSVFEKLCKKALKKTEEECNIYLIQGRVFAYEVKHHGNQCRYTISKKDNGSFYVGKTVLNWEAYDKIKMIGQSSI